MMITDLDDEGAHVGCQSNVNRLHTGGMGMERR